MYGDYGVQDMQLVWFEQLDEKSKNPVQNVMSRTEAKYVGNELKLVGNNKNKNQDKGDERVYNSKAVAFNDNESHTKKFRHLLNKKYLGSNDLYYVFDKIFVPRKVKV